MIFKIAYLILAVVFVAMSMALLVSTPADFSVSVFAKSLVCAFGIGLLVAELVLPRRQA